MGKKKSAAPAVSKKQSSEARHARDCKVCRHEEREAIEQEWISWGDTTQIAKDYSLSRNSIYRHAEMMGLFQKRDRNIRAALGRINRTQWEVARVRQRKIRFCPTGSPDRSSLLDKSRAAARVLVAAGTMRDKKLDKAGKRGSTDLRQKAALKFYREGGPDFRPGNAFRSLLAAGYSRETAKGNCHLFRRAVDISVRMVQNQDAEGHEQNGLVQIIFPRDFGLEAVLKEHAHNFEVIG